MMNDEFNKQMAYGIQNKPRGLIISDLKWKYLLRCVLRGENILLIGHTGTGKTLSAKCVADTLKRKFYIFNCGSSQDARSMILGNAAYDKNIGTIFYDSEFINAIQTENAIILLDELTRSTHDLLNIILPTIDPTQRTLRIDEKKNSPIVKVANGVCFLASANIGNEYTATRVLDKAISGRFPIKIEMDLLKANDFSTLFSLLYPSANSEQNQLLCKLASISDDIYSEYLKEDSNITTFLSPRSIIKMSELVLEGFTLTEISEVAIYPEYSDDGGMESERTFIKQILQKYIDIDIKNPVKDPRKK